MSSSSAESAQQTQPVYRNSNLQVLFGATLVSVLGVSGVAPAFPKIVRALAIDPQDAGWLITAYTVPGIVLTPMLGALADRVGRKRVLTVALVVFALAGTSCALARTFDVLLLLRVLQGMGAAPIIALNVALIGDLFDGRARTAAVGYNSAALNVGTASYPAIGGVVAMLGWHWPFALPIIALPMAGLVAWKLDVPEGTTATQNDRGKSSLQSLWAVLRQPAVVGLLLASVMNFVLLFGSYVTYVPELVDRQFTSQSAIIGLVVSSASISNGIAATQVARMARLVARRWLVAGAFALSAAALAVIPLMASVWGVVAAAIGFGAAQGTGVTATLALLTDWAPDAQRATVLSVNATAIRLGQTIGPAVMGGVLAAAGLNAVFFAGGVLAVLMVGVLAVLLTTRPTASS
jgi:MFS family permease